MVGWGSCCHAKLNLEKLLAIEDGIYTRVVITFAFSVYSSGSPSWLTGFPVIFTSWAAVTVPQISGLPDISMLELVCTLELGPQIKGLPDMVRSSSAKMTRGGAPVV